MLPPVSWPVWSNSVHLHFAADSLSLLHREGGREGGREGERERGRGRGREREGEGGRERQTDRNCSLYLFPLLNFFSTNTL